MVGGLVFFIIFILVIAAIIKDGLFIVKQQHAVIIERLGKFNRFVGAGFHVKIPFFERKATTVSLRTMKNGFSIDVKTEDNVTIGLDISAQYHVDSSLAAPAASICSNMLAVDLKSFGSTTVEPLPDSAKRPIMSAH